MKLIDRDALPKGRVEWEDIAEAPTINAIPVQFIQDRIDSLQELKEYELEANGGYIGQVCFEYEALRALINYWKAEQEERNE